MNFLEWLNDVVRWFGKWIPRWDVCEPTHAGVKFRGRFFRSGIVTCKIEPGLYWWWPATTRCFTIPVVRQSVDLPSQSLATLDGESILVSTVLVVEITDAVKALTQNHDVDETIQEIGAAAAVDSVVGRKWKDLREAFADGDVDSELKKQAQSLLRRYGVRVIEARFTDCVKHLPIRSVGVERASIVPEWEL